jgi:hypothetical protein
MVQVFNILKVLACVVPLQLTYTAHAKTFVFEDDAGSFEIEGLGTRQQAEAFFQDRVAENEANHAICISDPGAFSIPVGPGSVAICNSFRNNFEQPNQRDANGMFYRANGTYLPGEFDRFYEVELASAIQDNAVSGWITDGLRVSGPMFADFSASGLSSLGGFDENRNPTSRQITFDRPMTLTSIDISIFLQNGAPAALGIFDLIVSSSVENSMRTISFDGPTQQTFEFGTGFSNITSLLLATNTLVSRALPESFREGGINFNNLVATVTPSTVPLPASIWLLGAGLLGLSRAAKLRRNS